ALTQRTHLLGRRERGGAVMPHRRAVRDGLPGRPAPERARGTAGELSEPEEQRRVQHQEEPKGHRRPADDRYPAHPGSQHGEPAAGELTEEEKPEERNAEEPQVRPEPDKHQPRAEPAE